MPAVELYHVVMQEQYQVFVFITFWKIILEDALQIFARDFIQKIEVRYLRHQLHDINTWGLNQDGR